MQRLRCQGRGWWSEPVKDTTMKISQILRKLRLGVRVRRFVLRDQRGNAMVELALGVTLCSTLIVGAAEFGWLAYQSIEVSNAARAGVQYGAQSRTDAAATANVQRSEERRVGKECRSRWSPH